MYIAITARERATCPRRQVGCVITQQKRIRGTGYNGAPSSLPHCTDIGCDMVEGGCRRTIHAEDNAIAGTRRTDRSGGTIYTTDFPCPACAHLIVDSGLVEVVWMIPYRVGMEETTQLLHYHGIIIRQFTPDLLLTEG